MTNKNCIICEAGGVSNKAVHIIQKEYEYLHLCDHHFWMLREYFNRWND